ncbi:hypothetical protein [Asticcacaulis taihuensis]|uniref:hypothetical protein n=1 Tax=Asticcacaulis taihuensis TaxID=260084 RepID=UPI0026F35630|nr:hypothetical protein [Asticcacaulis taihuensis]
MKSSFVFSVFALAIIAGQANAIENKPYVMADALKPAEAESDAARDFHDGKCIIYVIDGRPRNIPGPDLHEETAGKSYTLIYIEGVGDNLTPQVIENNKKAVEYATEYNNAAVKNCGAGQ